MADQSMPVTGDPPPSTASHRITATPNAPQIQGAYYSNPYTSQQCATFVHRFFSILVGCISFTGIIIYIFWLIWVARIGYPEFRIKTLTLSNSRISSYYLIPGDCDVHFIIRNPNSKITLYYDQVQAVVRVQFSPWGGVRRTFIFYCSNLPIAVSSKGKSGTLQGGPKKCTAVDNSTFINGRPPEVGACGFVADGNATLS
ncbi:hypothetical protein L1887_32514 [Cichorium endivia]|nr:hypothetical protein L1887_32514 [Cichorium endivia]